MIRIEREDKVFPVLPYEFQSSGRFSQDWGSTKYQNREPGQDWMTMKLRGKYTLPEHIRSKAPELRQYLEVNGFGMRWHSPMNGGAPINRRSRQVKDIWKKEKGKKTNAWEIHQFQKNALLLHKKRKKIHIKCASLVLFLTLSLCLCPDL